MQTVIRYINSTSSDVVAGGVIVPKYDQIIATEFIPALDVLAGKSLTVLVDGVVLSPDLVPANIVEEEAAILDTKTKQVIKPK
jgi:hypothetical protein